MTNSGSINRYQAFLIHLAASALILLSVLGFIVWRFYPGFYFHAEGAWTAAKILILVDLVLGPLLTLIIFKVGKKGLKFDLAMIALFQLSALIYGSYVLYSERPGYLVFSIDRFEVAEASEVDHSGAQEKAFALGPFSRPKIVFAAPPEEEEMQELLKQLMAGGKDLYLLSRYYEAFAANIDTALLRQLDSSEFLHTAEDQLLLGEFLAKHRGGIHDYSYFPLVGNSDIMLAVVNPSTGKLVSVLGINPWKDLIKKGS